MWKVKSWETVTLPPPETSRNFLSKYCWKSIFNLCLENWLLPQRIIYHIICIVILFLVRRFGMFSFVIQWEIYSYLTWQSASPELYLKLNHCLSYAPVTSFFSSTTFCWRICFLTSLTLFPTILLCSVSPQIIFLQVCIYCKHLFP